MYKNIVDSLPEHERKIEKENELVFSSSWIRGWMKEYNVSLSTPNKRFAVSKADVIERVLELLKNVMRTRKYSIEKFNIDPIIINGDQMPIHR